MGVDIGEQADWHFSQIESNFGIRFDDYFAQELEELQDGPARETAREADLFTHRVDERE